MYALEADGVIIAKAQNRITSILGHDQFIAEVWSKVGGVEAANGNVKVKDDVLAELTLEVDGIGPCAADQDVIARLTVHPVRTRVPGQDVVAAIRAARAV